MRLRKFEVGDIESLARTMSLAFGGNIPPAERYFDPEENPRLDLEGVYVVEEDGEVRASATVLPLEMFADGRAVPMGGISAVATHPAYRRRGYAGELMRAVLEDMRGRGVHLSLLAPFAHPFYRAYGWELATEGIGYTFKPDELPASKEQRFIRDYRTDDLPEMQRLLETEAARHPCGIRRSGGRWRQILFDKEGPYKDLRAAVYGKRRNRRRVSALRAFRARGPESVAAPNVVRDRRAHAPGPRRASLVRRRLRPQGVRSQVRNSAGRAVTPLPEKLLRGRQDRAGHDAAYRWCGKVRWACCAARPASLSF